MRRTVSTLTFALATAGALTLLPLGAPAAAKPKPDHDAHHERAHGERHGNAESHGKGHAKMRFEELDTDRDGVVTREEWRGNDVSFARHDANEDGVLSGSELMPAHAREGEPYDEDRTAYRFAKLDRDENGRITRDEWPWDDGRFERLDDDGDGALTPDELPLDRDAPHRDRAAYFTTLDDDGNGFVERAEWPRSEDAFASLDTNDDGRLSRDEFVGS